MYRTKPATFGLLIVLLGIFSFVYAGRCNGCPGAGGQGPHKKMMHKMIVDKLGLQEEQIEQMQKLHDQMQDFHQTHRSEMDSLKSFISTELKKDAPDRQYLNQLSAQMGASAEKLSQKRIEHMLDLKELLTEDQFEKLLQHHETKRPRGPGGKGHFRGNPQMQ